MSAPRDTLNEEAAARPIASQPAILTGSSPNRAGNSSEATTGTTSPAGPSLRTIMAVVCTMAGLFALDHFLAAADRAERRATAARVFLEGNRLSALGRDAEALERYRTALSEFRENEDYQLAVVSALAKLGRFSDAGTELSELLRADPANGAANLAMARILAATGKVTGAEIYYHRAIYGLWPPGASGNRATARFELADLLAQNGDKTGLLAELLPLQEQAPEDAQTRKRIARLFVIAGSPARAADIYQRIIRTNQMDAQAWTGLGEAEFAQRNYAASAAALRSALRADPHNRPAQQLLEICSTVLELDPAARRLSFEERYSRSRKLAELALEELRQCASGQKAPAAGPVLRLVESAGAALRRKKSARERLEAIEKNVALAEALSQARKQLCRTEGAALYDPVELVLAKIAE
jgi:tetratricopeptide (TPR) repeat protein